MEIKKTRIMNVIPSDAAEFSKYCFVHFNSLWCCFLENLRIYNRLSELWRFCNTIQYQTVQYYYSICTILNRSIVHLKIFTFTHKGDKNAMERIYLLFEERLKMNRAVMLFTASKSFNLRRLVHIKSRLVQLLKIKDYIKYLRF